MARNSYSKSVYPVSSSRGAYLGNSQKARRQRDAFGPGMAEDIFGWNSFDECDEVCDSYEAYDEVEDDAILTDMYDGVLQSFHFRHQTSLDLETNEQREARLNTAIERFDNAYKRMCLYALKWHYLQEDLEADPQLKKQFQDIQLMRKLKGSDGV